MLAEESGVKIGLEIHVPLKTKQKLFCDCPTDYYATEQPNTNICPVCTGMPGSKPYPINSAAVDTVLMVGRLLECRITYDGRFVKRKHYNYPDLPSGYQRTSEPFGVDGNLAGVGIWEVHLEEDPGRYDLATGRVDYNRSGVPLIEIVTAPDMKSADDVRNFLKELINLLRYTERIVDVGGVMRMDVNISIAGGARVEIKNINSIRGAYKAILYEIIRQKNLKKRGSAVVQETRGFNDKSLITVPMRVKETEDDYRYIPDPDIPPLMFEAAMVEKITLPETPLLRKKRIVEKYAIKDDYADILVKDKSLVDLFEDVSKSSDPQIAASWISREVIRQLNYRSIDFSESKLSSQVLSELFGLIGKNAITENTGKKILERVIDSGESPEEIVKKEGLGRVDSREGLESVVAEVLAENSEAVADYRAGNADTLNFLMGKVMQKMRGRADAGMVVMILKKNL